MRSAQSSAGLIVGEDGLEGRSMTVEEELVSRGVVEAQPLSGVAEQRRRMAVEQGDEGLEVEAAHVDTQSITQRPG